MSENLSLVILTDRLNHNYTVWDHNLAQGQAEELVKDLRSKLLHAFSVRQEMHHAREDAEACRSCRKDVRHARELPPRLRFQRRNQ
jgi:nucleotidyltransferase/DNA polymerase involved in DNA repair